MKVELNNANLDRITHSQDNRASAATSANSLQELDGDDTATLSTDSATVGSLTSQALASPEIRQDKVGALRQAIQSGSYKVDADSVANAMIQDSN
jgi:negative regulator of flagellin synthesis FlgM